jgi:glycosyltransferase involved in cell wall biosynthesis
VGQSLSGVGVYSREILFGLARRHPEADFRFCYRPHRLLRSFRERIPFNASRRVLLASHTPQADVFHGLNQRLPPEVRTRAACTFHDLFVLTGEYSTPDFRKRFALQAREAAERSDIIICVSSYTANQVRDLLNIDASRLRVVPHGVHCPEQMPSEAARERLILHVGALQTRKNIVRIIDAFERVLPDYRLALAGSDGYGADAIHARINSSPRRKDIDVLGYVDDRRLRELYSRAAIFVFPSLDEGFGIPVLEAMAWAVPVITSSSSALPEAAGDAAILVNPLDANEIAAGFERLAEDTELRDTLVQRGLERAKRFTWRRAVEKTWEIYRELLRV